MKLRMDKKEIISFLFMICDSMCRESIYTKYNKSPQPYWKRTF